jgi:hypothetical protein
MPGIPREVAEHALEIRASSKPVKQRLRRLDKEKCKVIGEEIHKLLKAGFIKVVHHPEWLANPVLVKKKNGKWRMCVDYTSLNKACPKVPFPLPHIDQIVHSTAVCETLSFLDAYSGYHQIKMKESDQLVTSFITPFGMYCYVTMPFGLWNAGATYQRCMQHVFARDLHQPSVNIRADGGVDGPSLDPPPEAEAPLTRAEAMQAEGSTPPANPEPDWRIPYLDHLTRGDLPLDKIEARRIARRTKSFVIFGDSRELYRCSPTGVLQRCITNEEGRNLLNDLHSGACGHHAAPRTLVGNAFRQGFYWPTAVSDAVKLVCSCKGCQYYARQTHLPAHALQTIPITWSFAVWGLDLVGPLKRTTGGFTHLLVAVDKFSKWIEACPITSIRSEQAMLFFYRHRPPLWGS